MGQKGPEVKLEQAARKKALSHGLLLLKWTGPRGCPDRILLGPDKTIAFIEFKRPGGQFQPLQKDWHAKLRAFGFPVFVCCTMVEFEAALQWL